MKFSLPKLPPAGFFILLGCLLLTSQNLLLAQSSRTVSGTVTDTDGDPIPGVNVLVKDTEKGTITNINGAYNLSVTQENPSLIFSFIGYLSKEVALGNKSSLDVTLSSDTKQLSEVIVSALGFEEDADIQGSTQSVVEGQQLASSGETGLINAISGKASGVQITQQSSDPGAGSFIQIRGMSTIAGNTQPLIVIDGIPISNTLEGNSSGGGGVKQQSRLNDINPNDIASMTILKGAAAAALWGSRAANGVINITTKQGKKSDKINISYSTTFSLDRINKFHPRQNKFGQGSNGEYDPTDSRSYGDKISERPGGADLVDESGEFFEALDGNRYYPILERNAQEEFVEDNFDAVFGDGYYFDNNLNVSGGDDKTNYYFSLGNFDQKGIQQGNSEYRRTTIRSNLQHTFNSVVEVQTNTTYINSLADRIQQGNNTSGSMLGLLRNPPDFNVRDYKGYYYANENASPVLRQRSYRRYLGDDPYPIYNNPLWPINEQENSTLVNRFINSTQFKITPADWFHLIARGGIDSYTDEKINYFPINDSGNRGNGTFTEQITKESELNLDLIGRFFQTIGTNFGATYTVGFNINSRNYYNTSTQINNFLIDDGPISFSNAVVSDRFPSNEKREIRTSRLYATANFSAFDALYLNLSGAAETSSTFGDESDKTFYYPSADLAWQFTELNALDDLNFLSFGKLRLAYGIVGIQPLPYRTTTVFVPATFSNAPFGDNLNGAQFGEGAFLRSTEQGDSELKPERKTEYEIGTDLRFFNDRLSTSFTYYQNKVVDMLIPVTLAPSVGFATQYTNAASLENKGIEIDVNMDVISTPQLLWSVYANFNRNRNKVLSLAGTESLFLEGREGRADSRAVVGEPLGVIWGGKFAEDEEGNLILDENNFPTVATQSGVIGDPNPDWRGGLGSTLAFRNFTLDFLFETNQGADFHNGTRGVMYNFGTHADTGNEVTLAQDLQNYAGETIPAGSTVRGNIKDWGGGPVLLDQSFYTDLGSGFGPVNQQFMSDGSWTRLRKLSLSYRLQTPGFQEATKLRSVEISLTGRNLFLWTDVVGIDPDTNLGGSFFTKNMDYFNTPGSKSYIVSLIINY